MATLRFLPELLEKADPEMHAFLSRAAAQEGHMHTLPSPSALYGAVAGKGKGKQRAPAGQIRVPSPFNCHFAVSWQLTWFSHTVTDFDSVCRLFDLFLVRPRRPPSPPPLPAPVASRAAASSGPGGSGAGT